MKRREFIQKSTLASVGTMLIPSFLKAFEQERQLVNNHKKLVIIQLSGGNDGLNTVVPFQNDIYYQSRPRLAVPKNEILKLNDELGLNPVLSGLKSVYDEGSLTIINNVGYPNPDRSHFRSMDIWQTGSSAEEYWTTGWLGRYLDSNCQGNCEAHQAIEVDDSLSLTLKGQNIKGLAVRDADKLRKVTQGKLIQALTKNAKNHTDHEHNNVAYLYKTLAETSSSADYIYQTAKTYNSKVDYPQNQFAQRLKTIASFINSGLDTQIYYASLTGFDTHVNQKRQQERLLKIYSDAVQVLVKDLKQTGNLDNTLVMTFSEFGRRVAQNASNGTDHGTANNVFIMGGKLRKAGIYNESPNLLDLDKGDLKYKVDFRKVYATLLKKHLQTEPKSILKEKFDLMNFI